MIKIGLVKETKVPVDHRVALPPKMCQEVLVKFPHVKIVVQPSQVRCYKDSEYKNIGLEVNENLRDCDFLIGIKEVKINKLIPEKAYLFFSHTAKKQPHNRPLLQAILANKNTLIDYEYLTDPAGKRVVAFGKYAGLVGAYNALLAYGKRYKKFSLKPAHQCRDLAELKKELKKVNLKPDTRIILTGTGRVGSGAATIMEWLKIKKVSPPEFLEEKFSEPVYCPLSTGDYVAPKNGQPFDFEHFVANPQEYKSIFKPYTQKADIFIACHFWDPKSPHFFSPADMKNPDFRIKVIADISCDVPGPIPATLRSSTIAEPIYGYDPATGQESSPYDEKNITVMAVDNLPCELPRDSSTEFAENLINNVFPHLFGEDKDRMITNATIAKDGKLTDKFKYLSDYVNNK